MHFGLINALDTFQKMIEELMKDIPFARAYLDGVIIHFDTIEGHVEHLQVVLCLLRKSELGLRFKKCSFGTDSVELLGPIVSTDGVKIDQKRSRLFVSPLFSTILLLSVASSVLPDTIVASFGT